MSGIYLFATIMVLFWILVQQICLCCIKWAYEDILGRGAGVRRYIAANVAAFLFCLLLAFGCQFDVDPIFPLLPSGLHAIYHRLRWNFFCNVMLMLDALLVAYALRIYRLYMSPSPEAGSKKGVFFADLLIGGAFFGFFLLYHWGLCVTVQRHTLSLVALDTIQFFYIKIANFFYAFFEGTLAVLLWKIYRRIERSEVRV